MLIFIVHLPNIAMLFEYFGAKKLWFQIKQKFRPKSKRMKKRILNVLFFIAGRVGTLKKYMYLTDFSLKVLSTSNEIVLNSVVPVRDLY